VPEREGAVVGQEEVGAMGFDREIRCMQRDLVKERFKPVL
jgi:hypothetical protein